MEDDLGAVVIYLMLAFLAGVALLVIAAAVALGWALWQLGRVVAGLIELGLRRWRERRAYPIARRDVSAMFDSLERRLHRS